MAVVSSSNDLVSASRTAASRRERAGVGNPAWFALEVLGSLKITVVMFMLGIVILLVGTLAQDSENLAAVKRDYFNSVIAIVPVDVFFPDTLFPTIGEIPGWFPLPGGATIGVILLLNLIAAKVTRFSISSKGTRFAAGLITLAIGIGLTALIIIGAHSSDGLQGEPPISYDTLWVVLKGCGILLPFVLGGVAMQFRKNAMLIQIVSWSIVGIFAALAVFLVVSGDSIKLDEPALRIMWQLIQSGAGSLVLLAGCLLLFGKRGGNVLLHLGIGLLMIGQFAFGDRQIEQRMTLREGQSTNMAYETDRTELAIVDTSDPEFDEVYVVPEWKLKAASASKKPIDNPELPVKIEVVQFIQNSLLKAASQVNDNPATKGQGLRYAAVPIPTSGGANSEMNIVSAYVKLTARESGEELGTYLVSQFTNDQAQVYTNALGDENDTIEIAGKQYQLGIRFKRNYKPYTVTLTDVRRITYSGTETPRDFSSYVELKDHQNNRTQTGRIWMNNPMRYEGETFYQSSYDNTDVPGVGPVEITGLQVVENAGWMIPYVSCIMVGLGMMVHFGVTFTRFAGRYDRQVGGSTNSKSNSNDDGKNPYSTTNLSAESKATKKSRKDQNRKKWDAGNYSYFAAIAAVLLVIGLSAYAAYPRPANSATEMDWYAAGELPTLYEGRVKPLDTTARTVLQALNGRDYGKNAEGEKFTATQWFLGVVADQKWTQEVDIFRIDAKEVIDLFDLEKTKSNRYSYQALRENVPKLREQIATFRTKPASMMSFTEKKFLEINQKLSLYELVYYSYRLPPLPDDPVPGDSDSRERFSTQLSQLMEFMQRIEESHPPGLIPNPSVQEETGADDVEVAQSLDAQWQALGPAIFRAYATVRIGIGEVNPAVLPFTDIVDSLRSGNPKEFNAAIKEYKEKIADFPAIKVAANKPAFEAWLNKFNPDNLSIYFYFAVVLLCFVGMLFDLRSLRTGLICGLVVIFAIHTLAIVARIYISGRPPVTTLYTSAVFVGWSCVLFGIVLEVLYPRWIGILAAASVGYLSMMVAYGLDTGDTMPVLQAVLDTQFWLSTHVVTVTLGYAATFMAGALGLIAIIHRAKTGMDRIPTKLRNSDDVEMQNVLYRMSYGIVCFAMFFSFVGTVLGGLWADDSWGRFWGWDPKENGALIIVLWNAAILHARWDKWIGQRGFALMAIGGNIVTAWSWFGTNQLGIGLHSYGFTSGIVQLLLAFVTSQLAVIIIGGLMTRSGDKGNIAASS